MSKRTIAKGSDSDIIEALTEALYESGAIDHTKFDAFRRLFSAQMMDSPGGRKNPEAYGRHMGRILGKLLKEAPPSVELATQVAPMALDPFAGILSLDDEFVLSPNDEAVLDAIFFAEALETALNEWAVDPKHPFIRYLDGPGGPYAMVGTATIRKPDVTWNLGCTTGNFAKLKDADEKVLVHRNGRPVMKSKDIEGSSYFVWLVHFKVSRSFRFWANEARKNGPRQDNPAGAKRIIMVEEEPHFRIV
jgi:hypothetical protein